LSLLLLLFALHGAALLALYPGENSGVGWCLTAAGGTHAALVFVILKPA
jgi:hypothetical protein